MSALVLAAILTLAPALELGRAQRYADDIALACGDEWDLCAAMVATQHEESHFRTDIETCAVTGDGGASVAAYQLGPFWRRKFRHTIEQLCASNGLAAKDAAAVLREGLRVTGGWAGALRWYVRCKPGDPRSVKRIKAYRQIGGKS